METHSLPDHVLKVRPIIVACAMMATVMQALDTTIANVALPYMQGALSATLDQINWVLTSYIVAAAIMTPPVGWLTQRYGRKAIFLTSVLGFTVASMLCGVAGSLTQIVFYRLLQGVFGAALVPLSQATMLDLYPAEQRGSAMAMWGMGVMLGPILGPTLGGWLTESYSWRFVFFVNLPVGILCFLGFFLTLPDTERDTTTRLDFFGFGMLSLGIGALQMMLDRGESQNWFSSPEIQIELVLSLLGFYMFLVQMFTAEKPFIRPTIFADRNLSVGLVFIFIVGVVLLATLALLTPYLQTLMGYPVLTAGLVLGPRGLGTMIAMMLVGRLSNSVDARLLMLFGLGLTVLALYDMTGFTTDTSQFEFVETGLIQGFGLGFVFVPLQTVSFGTLAPNMRTEGAALLSLMRNIGSSIGISIVTFLLVSNTTLLHAQLSESITPFSRGLAMLPKAAGLDPSTLSGAAMIDNMLTQQGTIIAYANDFRLMMYVTIAAIPLLLIMKSPNHQPGAKMEHAVME